MYIANLNTLYITQYNEYITMLFINLGIQLLVRLLAIMSCVGHTRREEPFLVLLPGRAWCLQ